MRWTTELLNRIVSPEIRALVQRIELHGIAALDRKLWLEAQHGDFSFCDWVYLRAKTRPYFIAQTKNTIMVQLLVPEQE